MKRNKTLGSDSMNQQQPNLVIRYTMAGSSSAAVAATTADSIAAQSSSSSGGSSTFYVYYTEFSIAKTTPQPSWLSYVFAITRTVSNIGGANKNKKVTMAHKKKNATRDLKHRPWARRHRDLPASPLYVFYT